MQVNSAWLIDPYQLFPARRGARLLGMNASRRLCLLLLLALVLPLQSLAGSLLAGDPCPMSQEAPQPTDCCDEGVMPAGSQLCPDMSKCPTAGLPLAASQRLKLKLLPGPVGPLLLAQAELPSRPLAAPWRPPRA
jgi:hypothetical protein